MQQRYNLRSLSQGSYKILPIEETDECESMVVLMSTEEFETLKEESLQWLEAVILDSWPLRAFELIETSLLPPVDQDSLIDSEIPSKTSSGTSVKTHTAMFSSGATVVKGCPPREAAATQSWRGIPSGHGIGKVSRQDSTSEHVGSRGPGVSSRHSRLRPAVLCSFRRRVRNMYNLAPLYTCFWKRARLKCLQKDLTTSGRL